MKSRPGRKGSPINGFKAEEKKPTILRRIARAETIHTLLRWRDKFMVVVCLIVFWGNDTDLIYIICCGSCLRGKKLEGFLRDLYPIKNLSKTRVQLNAVNKLIKTPIPRVVANPFTKLVPQ